MSSTWVSSPTSGRARCARSPRPVSVGARAAWPAPRNSGTTFLQHHPPNQAGCTSTNTPIAPTIVGLSRAPGNRQSAARPVSAGPAVRAAEALVVRQGAAVLHDVEAGRDEGGGDAIVADAELEPDDAGRWLHGQEVVEVVVEGVRPAEDVDEVDRLGEVGQARAHGLVPQGLAGQLRVDRQHTVALAVQVVGHVERGPVRLVVGAQDRDDARTLQHLHDVRLANQLRHPANYARRGTRAPATEAGCPPCGTATIARPRDRASTRRPTGRVACVVLESMSRNPIRGESCAQ